MGGLTVSCQNDGHFARLRSGLGYDPWLLDALAAFDWGAMAAGGGKGGNKMARTPCKRLFVKEVSGGDEQTLSSATFLEAYVNRVSTRASLVVHLLLHFTRPDGQTCVVMNNWLPVRLGHVWRHRGVLQGGLGVHREQDRSAHAPCCPHMAASGWVLVSLRSGRGVHLRIARLPARVRPWPAIVTARGREHSSAALTPPAPSDAAGHHLEPAV